MTQALEELLKFPPDTTDWRIARRCTVCRRWLTAPSSIAAGAGPTCRGRNG